jgi:hypothetical protein
MEVLHGFQRVPSNQQLYDLNKRLENLEKILGQRDTVKVVKSVNTKLPNKIDGSTVVYARNIKYMLLNRTVADLFTLLIDADGNPHIHGDLIVDGNIISKGR